MSSVFSVELICSKNRQSPLAFLHLFCALFVQWSIAVGSRKGSLLKRAKWHFLTLTNITGLKAWKQGLAFMSPPCQFYNTVFMYINLNYIKKQTLTTISLVAITTRSLYFTWQLYPNLEILISPIKGCVQLRINQLITIYQVVLTLP